MFAKSRHGRFDSPTPAEPLGAWPAFASAPCVMFAQSRRQPGLAARRHALVGAAQATAACAMFAQSRRRTRDSAAGATTVVGRPKVAAVRDVRQINARHAGLAGPRPRLADGRRVVVDVVAAARTPCAQRRASGRGGIVRPINRRGARSLVRATSRSKGKRSRPAPRVHPSHVPVTAPSIPPRRDVPARDASQRAALRRHGLSAQSKRRGSRPRTGPVVAPPAAAARGQTPEPSRR
jgi:hypothetical protein